MNKEGRNKGKMDGVEGWTENKGGRAARGGGVARWKDLKRDRNKKTRDEWENSGKRKGIE